MNYTPEQIAEIVLKVLQEVNITPNVSKLSTEERLKLANDPNATVEILQSLSRDEYSYVRSGVSQHPNATVEILQSLSRDENSGVREEAMKNPNYKPKTLELTSAQYESLKTLLKSSQDEILKSVTL